MESTLQGDGSGVRTGVDVLNAQHDLAQVRYQYLLSRLRLKNATGSLGEADTAELNSLLAGG